MWTINCQTCGKFVSQKDIEAGKCKWEELWDKVACELIDVVYWCAKCTEKKKEGV